MMLLSHRQSFTSFSKRRMHNRDYKRRHSKERLNYKRISYLEPLFDDMIAVDEKGHTKSYTCEQLRNEYNRLIDDICHYLLNIYDLDQELEAYIEAYHELVEQLESCNNLTS